MTDPERVIQQRMRNRVIEYLELAGSFDAQRTYDSHRMVNVAYEVINQWEDCVPNAPWEDEPIEAVYSPNEIEAMAQFHRVWTRAATAIPSGYPDLSDVQVLPEWSELQDQAQRALAVFLTRGKMPEDRVSS